MSRSYSIAAAPASIGNVAVGFDCLGLALTELQDEVVISRRDDKLITIDEITGIPMNLPDDPTKNTCGAALLHLQKKLNLAYGFSIKINKGIPLASGLGGSAASAVAAVVAANELLDTPLSKEELLPFALAGESVASGCDHMDNVAPSLLGGLILCLKDRVYSIPLPEVSCTLLHPHIQIETKSAREMLSPTISLEQYVEQSQHLAGFIAGCYEPNFQLIKENLKDTLVEPQRKALIPHFDELKKLATEEEDCLGCSISGAGPSVFCLTAKDSTSKKIKDKWKEHLDSVQSPADIWCLRANTKGAVVE